MWHFLGSHGVLLKVSTRAHQSLPYRQSSFRFFEHLYWYNQVTIYKKVKLGKSSFYYATGSVSRVLSVNE